MQTSLFIAKLLGPLLIVVGLGMLANGPAYRTIMNELLDSAPLVYLSGVLAFLGGLAIVLTHNVWVLDWPLIITLTGWLGLLRGAVRIVLPQQSMAIAANLVARDEIFIGSAIAALVLGAILGFYGYLG